jgi:hypothetical protein
MREIWVSSLAVSGLLKFGAFSLSYFCVATLMRPSDMSKEFADMAGKALTIEWLVENALEVFDQPAYS